MRLPHAGAVEDARTGRDTVRPRVRWPVDVVHTLRRKGGYRSNGRRRPPGLRVWISFRARGSALFEIALGSTSVDRNLEQWTLPVQWSAPSQLSDEARLEADAAVATQVLRQLATLASVDAPDYHQQGGVVVSVNVVSAA